MSGLKLCGLMLLAAAPCGAFASQRAVDRPGIRIVTDGTIVVFRDGRAIRRGRYQEYVRMIGSSKRTTVYAPVEHSRSVARIHWSDGTASLRTSAERWIRYRHGRAVAAEQIAFSASGPVRHGRVAGHYRLTNAVQDGKWIVWTTSWYRAVLTER